MILRHSRGSYEIAITDFATAMASLPTDRKVITDKNVRASWPDLLAESGDLFAIEPGEASKCLDTYSRLLSWCADTGAGRSTTIVAVGGGVVGDLAGFVAATYMRGVDIVQVPTTLLAQVDAAIGGKTGIDLAQGKNLAGAFHQPVAVHVPLDSLRTLDPRHFRSGVAEIVKYGFIQEPRLVAFLEEDRLEAHDEGLPRIVEDCIAIKARIVEEDEFERSGGRAVLNFGHTVGHALELLTGFGPLLHGEAVAIGMCVEARIGEAMGITPMGTAERVEAVLKIQGLPHEHEALGGSDELLKAMSMDKKARGGKLAFSLLTGPGECKLVENVPSSVVGAALTA